MRIAILESIVMPAGHEVEFDRILVEELKKQGHDPRFFVPEHYPFKLDYHVPIDYLKGGEAVSYAGASRLEKILLSLQREHRRITWFNDAAAKAQSGLCDAIIVPTATYRYLRTLRRSDLINTKVPLIFIFHGINPHEQPKFEKQARLCEAFPNIRLKIVTLRDDFKRSHLSNIDLIEPPVFKPQDIPVAKKLDYHPPIKIGFFGQFRKEKNLGFFLKAFTQANFSVPVQLIVQGATAKPEDGRLFEQFAHDYAAYSNITFWHKNLLGLDWEKALLDVDVIMMPYAAERYRYHWGAMLFTAIGFYKPVLCSPQLNPEVLAKYKVGMAVKLDNETVFAKQMEEFIADLVTNSTVYKHNLDAANLEYSHEHLIKNILDNINSSNKF